MESWEGQIINDTNPASWVRLLNLSTADWGVGPLPAKAIIALPGALNDSYHFDNTTIVLPNAGATTLNGQPAYAVTVGVVSGLSILLTCVWLFFQWDTLWSPPGGPRHPPRDYFQNRLRVWPLKNLWNGRTETPATPERRNGHPRGRNNYEHRSSRGSYENYEMRASPRRSSPFPTRARSAMTATMTVTTEMTDSQMSQPYADLGPFGTSAEKFDTEVRTLFYERVETELEEREKSSQEIDVEDVEAMMELVRRIPELYRELYGHRATRDFRRERQAIIARKDAVWGEIQAVAADWRRYHGWKIKEKEQLASILKTLRVKEDETAPEEGNRRSYNSGFNPGPGSHRSRR
jgi:hypothetical protein